MRTLEKISLFTSKRDFFLFFLVSIFTLTLSISYQYYKYYELTKFDSKIINATVLKQYTKHKTDKKGKTKTYQVLKLKSNDGYIFYTIAKKNIKNIKNKNIKLEIWAGKINFYDFMTKFFSFSKIQTINPTNKISKKISLEHNNKEIAQIYKALFLAQPLSTNLQQKFSALGISHLIAISGFHLGVLSFIIFLLLKYPYKFLQNRYFPYRNYKRDIFIITASILLIYMIFISMPASMLRAYVMFIIGFILYERGFKIVSMQTLIITIIITISLFPRLAFNIGFWLSISGVFYIFLFFINFKNLNKKEQFFLLPFWLYLVMLPYSLNLFGIFSIYHPLSIFYSIIFTLFYPLSLLFHILNIGDSFDIVIKYLLDINLNIVKEHLNTTWLLIEIVLSLLSVFIRNIIYILLLYTSLIFIYFIYQVA